MTETERAINVAAEFLPQETDEGRPCIKVGGVYVWAYFDEGVLHVSAGYEDAVPEVQAEDGEVPTEVNIGGRLVWVG